jgi:hypothetical protein
MARMLAAAHGKNQAERPDCCRGDDKFRAPSAKRVRKAIQRAREKREWKEKGVDRGKETGNDQDGGAP